MTVSVCVCGETPLAIPSALIPPCDVSYGLRVESALDHIVIGNDISDMLVPSCPSPSCPHCMATIVSDTTLIGVSRRPDSNL